MILFSSFASFGYTISWTSPIFLVIVALRIYDSLISFADWASFCNLILSTLILLIADSFPRTSTKEVIRDSNSSFLISMSPLMLSQARLEGISMLSLFANLSVIVALKINELLMFCKLSLNFESFISSILLILLIVVSSPNTFTKAVIKLSTSSCLIKLFSS